MIERTRNRIIGGIFLAAVLVICVPMFFDKPLVLDVDLPPMPTVDLDDVEAPIHDEPDLRPLEQGTAEISSIVSDEGFLKNEGTRVGAPVLSFDADSANQWAVQLASFGNEESAVELRDSLLADGHRVWLSTAIVNESRVHRVVVGPYIKRDAANEQLTLFAERYQIEPVVVGFDY